MTMTPEDIAIHKAQKFAAWDSERLCSIPEMDVSERAALMTWVRVRNFVSPAERVKIMEV